VVETKNIKGWIFGSAYQKAWTQKIFKHSNKFQNPLHQNYKHVKTLQSLLELTDVQVHSLVVFVGDSIFKTPMPENVVHGGGYIRYIKSRQQSVLSAAEVASIVTQIEDGRLARSFKTTRDHVRHVKQIVVADKQQGAVCPKCGSPMVLRETRKGPRIGRKFYGCTTYPRCRGVVEVAQ
jgi:restriction system protein